MKEATVRLDSRTDSGKGAARQLRMKGRIPVVAYGPEMDPKKYSASVVELKKLFRQHGGSNFLVKFDIDGKGEGKEKAVIREIQRDPVHGDLLHMDFHQISMTKPLHITIPVRLTGISEGVKNSGAILQHIIREIEISCLPSDIPDSLQLDVTELGIHDSIHVRDVSIEGITILTEEQRTIVTVVPPTVATTTTEEEAEAEEGEKPEGAEEGEGDEPKAEEKKEEKES